MGNAADYMKDDEKQEVEPGADEQPKGSDVSPTPSSTSRWRRVRGSRTAPELEYKEIRRGRLPGDRFVRVVRPHGKEFKHPEPGYLVATEEAQKPVGAAAKGWAAIKRVLIGRPLASAMAPHERLTKVKALAVLSSDALSSSAYAIEEILLVLVLAGTGALFINLPVSLAIATLLGIVAFSYRQTIKAYPKGGGSYIVSKDNLGNAPALVAGSSLLIGYLLTVAVSISAGVAAITSAVPALLPYRVALAVFFVVLITIINLRGVREAGTIFSAPTYLFIFSIMVMILIGVFRAVAGGETSSPPLIMATQDLSILLVLRAFAAGCAALTGIEAISDGVPAFKPPESKNAATTLAIMATILAVLFLGVSFLAYQFGIIPQENETVVSQIARTAFGVGIPYYVVQAATMLILVLAANTAFSDFPRLSYFMARDKFLPAQFMFRGDKLAFSIGTVTLAVLAIVLILAFQASTHALMPLYAVGVFVSFTLSQSGMVRRWARIKASGWQRSMIINAIGACTTGIVASVLAASNFTSGAWIVIVLMPISVTMLMAIRRHYSRVSAELTVKNPGQIVMDARKQRVIVPVSGLDLSVLRSLSYATSISDDVTAVHITDDHEQADKMRKEWGQMGSQIPLIIVESPFRTLIPPLLRYIDAIHEQDTSVPITVVLSELIPQHWWEYPLHNQTALRLRAILFLRPNTVAVVVPYHLGH